MRCERNHLYEWRLSSQPDRSNDDVVCFGAPCNLQQFRERNDWLWSGKSLYSTLSLSFQTFLSRLVLGSCETCAETSTKSWSAINRVGWKRCSGNGWGEVLTKFPALSRRRSISRHCSGGEKRAWAGIVKGFIKWRTTILVPRARRFLVTSVTN